MEPILERTFFRSGSGALVGRTFLGARGTGGFFSRGVCLGTGGLVMREGRGVGVPLVAAVLVAEVGVRVVLGVVLTGVVFALVFFTSPAWFSVFVAEECRAEVVVGVIVVPFLEFVADAALAFATGGRC